MRLTDSPEEAAWRAEVREFLDQELPDEFKRRNRVSDAPFAGYEAGAMVPANGRPTAVSGGSGFRLEGGARGEWREKLATKGWIAPAWPKEYGGAGLDVDASSSSSTRRSPRPARRTSAAWASRWSARRSSSTAPRSRRRSTCRASSRGEVQWCQGFSEPGSGSDLASLQTRAVTRRRRLRHQRPEDLDLRRAARATGCSCSRAPTRTRRSTTASATSSLDMKTPGITVRPLINMAGQRTASTRSSSTTCACPRATVVGEENRGWYVGTTTLDFERSSIGSAVGIAARSVDELIDVREGARGRRHVAARPQPGRCATSWPTATSRPASRRCSSYRVVTCRTRGLDPEPRGLDGQAVRVGAEPAHRRARR